MEIQVINLGTVIAMKKKKHRMARIRTSQVRTSEKSERQAKGVSQFEQ